MAEENELTAPSSSSAKDSDQGGPGSVLLVSYPKIVFLYPTLLVAIFGAIFMYAKGNDPSADYATIPARIFLTVFAVNLVVIAFDFPRTTSLTWFFAGVAVFIGLWTLFRLNPNLIGGVSRFINSVQPKCNAMFYMLYILLMLGMYVCVMISRRFDYWEVRGNELLHHHGVLSDLERFSAPNLRIDKEINDIFEYLLLRSGRLILHPSQERRAIVLENVFFINQKEERITQMLGALQVRVRTDNN
ncbi:MAG: hypothetical protein R3C49_15120 [Planctomycetaceae bacterium]